MGIASIMSDLLTVKEVAAKLGLSTDSIYLMVKDGSLLARRIGPRGGKIMIATDELARYLKATESLPKTSGESTPNRRKSR